jgi:transposase
MLALVRARVDMKRTQGLLKTIKGLGDKSALACIALVPELGHVNNRAASALVGVAPFTRKSGTITAPARIHGGRAAVRNILYMAAVSASRYNPVLRPFYQRLLAKAKRPKSRVRKRSPQVRTALERCYRFLTINTVDSGAR